MKNIVLLFIATIAFSVNILAQSETPAVSTEEDQGWKQKTLFGSGDGKITHGFYGAPTLKYGQIDGKSAYLFGGKGAWVINHSIGIGLAGNSLMNKTYNSINNDVVGGFLGGNGGFMIEPVLFADRSIHVALPLVVGGGFVGKYVWFGDDFWDKGDYATFGYLEPGLEIEANIVSWFRVSVGAYYAFRWDLDAYKMSSDIISPLSIGATFKFGMF